MADTEAEFVDDIASWLAKKDQKKALVEVAAMVVALLRRVKQLESAPRLKFMGIHEPGYVYSPGMMVVRSGSLWHCNVATTKTPGTGGDWQMCVKSGSFK